MSSYAYVSLSLIGLCALAGAGVGVGSGVAMMYQQMAQAEQEQKSTGAVAHSPGIPPVHPYHLWLKVFTSQLAYRTINLFQYTDSNQFVQSRGKLQPQLADLLPLVPRASKLIKLAQLCVYL